MIYWLGNYPPEPADAPEDEPQEAVSEDIVKKEAL